MENAKIISENIKSKKFIKPVYIEPEKFNPAPLDKDTKSLKERLFNETLNRKNNIVFTINQMKAYTISETHP